MKKVLLLIGILLFSIQAFSQTEGEKLITLSGKVLDISTNKALDFASVNLKKSAVGIVTNSEGFFLLKIPSGSLTDSVVISFLGYRSQTISAQDLLGERATVIRLAPISYKLDPVIITSYDPLQLVKSALDAIDRNYPEEAVNMTSFYREKIKKKNSYILVNEAVLSINKAPYNSYKKDVIGILKGRGNYDEQKIDTLIIKFRGGAYSALEIDIAKNPFFGVESDIVGHYYDFTMAKPENIDKKSFMVVEFNQKPYLKDRLYRGKLYIDPDSKALARGEFAMNIEGIDSAYRFFVKSKPYKLKMEVMSANYLVNYREINGKWYFDYSKTELVLKTKWKGHWFSNTFIISSELAVTDILDTVTKIESANRLRFSDIISDKVKDYTDTNFWKDYNIIEPDADINKILGKIIKQLQKKN